MNFISPFLFKTKMKKTREEKRIQYLEQENLFLNIIKSITWNYHYYLDNYIKFIEKNDIENAKDFKIKVNSVKSQLSFYERKLIRFKNLYNKRDQNYAKNYGINKKIITEIIENFPDYYLHYNKKTDLQYKFIKDGRGYTGRSIVCEISRKKDERLVLEISANSSYLQFKFYYDDDNKYGLSTNVLEYILNILKINNRTPNNYIGNTLFIVPNNPSVSFISSNE